MTEATGIVGEFFALAEETDADLLAMQCGDFYEFFDDDAETVAEELDLTVSQKSSHGSSYPMAGVPVDDPCEDFWDTCRSSSSLTRSASSAKNS